MPKFDDLTGKQFGKITVADRIREEYKTLGTSVS